MISLTARTRADILTYLKQRYNKFPTMQDDLDYNESISSAIRELNNLCYNPRQAIKQTPTKTNDLTALQVDEICYVYFSNDSMFPNLGLGDGIGLIALFSRQQSMIDMESVGDYLILKGNLNIMNRHLKGAPDWEYIPPILHLSL